MSEVLINIILITDCSLLTLYNAKKQPKKLAKPPLPTSTQLANQVMSYIQANPTKLFPEYNEPQLTAIRSALTRRLTLIQGPPGKIMWLLVAFRSCIH